MMREVLEKLILRQDLTYDEATDVMESVACGKASPVQIGSFLTLLRAKGETPTEVTALVKVMIRHCVQVPLKEELKTLDIVGTGGDGANTVNLSTGAAILAAACGARVAKHGNRSVSSQSGSADVLEAMDVPLLQPSAIASCIQDAGIAFMYSPNFHPAMKHVVPVRRAIGVRTVFNLLGPLLNPAQCKYMLVGVYSPDLLDLFGRVLHELQIEHALVIHCAGLDELNPMGIAEAVEVTKHKGPVRMTIDPSTLGIPSCTLDDLKGGDARHNAAVLRSVFSGAESSDNAIGRTIALNAGAGLYVYGLASSIAEGYVKARETLRSGAALATLDKWSTVATKLQQQ